MHNYNKIQSLRVAMEAVSTWCGTLNYGTSRDILARSADWASSSPASLLDNACAVLPLLEGLRPSKRRVAIRALLVEALEIEDIDPLDLSAQDWSEGVGCELDDPFVGEVLIVEEGWDGWRLIHAQTFDRDEDGLALVASSWPAAAERYDVERTEDDLPLLFEHREELARLGEIEFSSGSTLYGPTPEAIRRVVAEVNIAKRCLGRDLLVFAAPLSSSCGAELEGERGDATWRFYGEPVDMVEARDVAPLWRGVAAGQLSAIISEARGRYFVSMVEGKTPHVATALALGEAVAAFEALRLEAHGERGWIIALAEIARSEGFGEALRDALRDARCEWAAAQAIEDVIRLADLERSSASVGQIFIASLGRLREAVRLQDKRVELHASRYAWRIARAIDLSSGGALRRWLAQDTDEAARIEIYDSRRYRSNGVSFSVVVDDETWPVLIDGVEVAAWAVVHGDEIMRTVKHVNYLALYESILKYENIRIVDLNGIFWREDHMTSIHKPLNDGRNKAFVRERAEHV